MSSMITGILEIHFIMHDSYTLKEKRSIVKKIIGRVKSKFNVSIAEVDSLDNCFRGTLGLAVVSNSKRHANSMLDTIVDFIEEMALVDIADVKMCFC